MNVQNMRLELSRFYGPIWKDKVRKMSDKQVQAVYFKFKQEGKIK